MDVNSLLSAAGNILNSVIPILTIIFGLIMGIAAMSFVLTSVYRVMGISTPKRDRRIDRTNARSAQNLDPAPPDKPKNDDTPRPTSDDFAVILGDDGEVSADLDESGRLVFVPVRRSKDGGTREE